MRVGICKDCKNKKNLTKHSLTGHHLPPFINLCDDCHKLRHWKKDIRSRMHRHPCKDDLKLMKESL